MRKRLPFSLASHILKIKEENARRLIELSREVKSLPWTKSDLEKVLYSLKNNKCRDPGGLINELFKPGVIGSDLLFSLLGAVH